MEGSVGQEHIPPWTYRDSVAAKRMTAQLVSASGSILGLRGYEVLADARKWSGWLQADENVTTHGFTQSKRPSAGAEEQRSYSTQESLTYSRNSWLIPEKCSPAKGKHTKKDVSLGERNDQRNRRFCSTATWSCGISMYSPLWVSIKNQHCHVSKIKLFRSEFPIPLRHQKKTLTATSEYILFFFPPQNHGRKTVYWSLLRNQMLL